jgi:predicted MFS family arabinose efflux permease
MDETGAMLGPLLMALVLWSKGADSYRFGYGILLASSLLALAAVVAARLIFPVPARLEEGGPTTARSAGFTRPYWLYMTAGAFFAAGLMSFELISYHLASSGAVTTHLIPVFLALATAMAVIATLILGRLYDRGGIVVVVGGVLLASVFSPFVFLGGFWTALAGLLLWGVGYAVQDTLLKALIASVLPAHRRNYAFGLFYIGYGSGWLIGSIVTGLLYQHSREALIAFAITVQLLSIPFFVLGARADRAIARTAA